MESRFQPLLGEPALASPDASADNATRSIQHQEGLAMSTLSDKRCVPCEGGIPALGAEAARVQMKAIAAEWRLADDARSLSRAFKFVDFYRTMSFVNALAHIANIEDHHPDLEVGYNYCRVRYSTHSVNGLSDNDFICAAKIDQLALK